ncbi:GNAT family N-acetyltransferase [Aeribacillus pallidus]|uniref:GNAT family N-acetyltransferase n=1 Tax=Aeribacillus pallidus TaxID=33936 RepID=UPI003D1C6ECB
MDIEKIYGNLPTLETERLLLRKITLDDVEAMFSYASNDEVTKYVTWDTHRSLADTKQYIDFVLSQYENKQIAPWGIESKETKEFIGTIDFVWWQPAHQKAEIGYVISDKYWGKGIATEASKKLIQFGFEEMDLVRIQAICFVENTASARVMEKVGMTFEGILRKAMFVKGKHRDLKMYSIIKSDIR